jgi:hypothetical protein
VPRRVPRVLTRVCALAADGKLRLTYKAQREALGLGLAPEDVLDVVLGLTGDDAAYRLVSRRTGEWMYVFKPRVGGQRLYVKLILRDECVVVSFHEDEGAGHDEDE